MNNPSQPKHEKDASAQAMTRRRKNRFALSAIVLMIALGLALSVLSNTGVRVTTPSRSAGRISLPTRSAHRAPPDS